MDYLDFANSLIKIPTHTGNIIISDSFSIKLTYHKDDLMNNFDITLVL